MADQKRWFKLWCSAPGDDDLQALPPEIRWAWAALGCYTKEHGTNGMIQINDSNKVLAAEMGVELSVLKETISVLPHVHIEEGTNRNGRFTVTWDNWRKYQEDSTGAARQQTLRSKRRGEENKKKRRITEAPNGASSAELVPNSAAKEFSASDLWIQNFLATQTLVNLPPAHLKALQNPDFWERTSEACGGIDLALLQKEFAKIGNWLTDNPSRVPTAKGIRRFVSGWLERSYEKERRYGSAGAR